ncbi:MAG: EscU/YscU/HrcU family type III secretion system export apparatus switch protein [Candidatus Eremiobacteraeota bacterium]|nr:EscU/YscU/HrcU family type III secretion system export apparatus switch protein [Candidatus Eremiobacteraeota bacterium]
MEKHFEATQSRIDAAKREGNIARSQDACAVAGFTGGIIGTLAVLPALGGAAANALVTASAGGSPSASFEIAGLMLVPMTAAAFASLGVSIMQTGGLRFVPLGMKFGKLNPADGFKRMFSREAFLHAIRASLAFSCATLVVMPAVSKVVGATSGGSGSIVALADSAWRCALSAAFAVAGIAGCFAALDYGVSFTSWRKKLRMSHEELKRDQKEQGGDPLARSRRRAMHRALSRESLSRVKQAAFVVTNPTHIAVALEYRPPEIAVPRVLVRAADATAARVREVAAEFRIPIIENVALARALYANCRSGEVIPIETYIAVAEIVAALVRTGALTA